MAIDGSMQMYRNRARLTDDDGVTNLEWYYEHDSDFAWKVDNWAWDASGFSTSQPLDEIPWTHPKMHDWLMAPHSDPLSDSESNQREQESNDDFTSKVGVSATDVDANDGNENLGSNLGSDLGTSEDFEGKGSELDSREKLEADVDNLLKNGFVTYAEIMALLDRQAAITRAEQREWWSGIVAELQAQLGNAADVNERQDLEYLSQCERIAKLTEQLEAAHAKNRALKLHIGKMQAGRHGWHVKGVELQQQVDELTAQLHASNAERARLRECLGIATDNAHDLLTLVDASGNVHDRDEGLA